MVAQPDNEVWPKAATLNAGATPTTVQGWLDQEGKSLWYKFHVDPGAQITVDLKNLPADYDVFLFKDIKKAYDAQATLANSKDLTKLSAEFAAVNVAPRAMRRRAMRRRGTRLRLTPRRRMHPRAMRRRRTHPYGYAPQAYAPQGYAPQGYAPQGYAPQGYAPQAYAPAGLRPPGVRAEHLRAAGVCQRPGDDALRSRRPGRQWLGDDLANSWNNTGDFYIRVSGKNGAFSADAPFSLSVTSRAASARASRSTTTRR